MFGGWAEAEEGGEGVEVLGWSAASLSVLAAVGEGDPAGEPGVVVGGAVGVVGVGEQGGGAAVGQGGVERAAGQVDVVLERGDRAAGSGRGAVRVGVRWSSGGGDGVPVRVWSRASSVLVWSWLSSVRWWDSSAGVRWVGRYWR
ncbi:hypothetical protein BJF80_06365 [Serinicoccus sp. CUA-874]|nr:hypothetical protein BJF80_06365 [Serinicoccus sp. CUA-874]